MVKTINPIQSATTPIQSAVGAGVVRPEPYTEAGLPYTVLERRRRMAKWVLRCEGFPDGRHCRVRGQFLQSFDPNAFKGRGDAVWTNKKKEARLFNTAADALEFWRQPSKVKPFRDDGLPNRPLTAFSVSVELAD